jgi:hypothetical protein
MPVLQAECDQDLAFQIVSGSPSAEVDQDLAFIVAQRLVPATIYTYLVSRPGDFVNANPLLRIGISPAERFC